MQQPTTPTKGPAADKLIKTIDHLSARWGLPLPRRDALWSPSKVPHDQCVEEKVVARIKFLSFKNQNALDNALDAFERYAMNISQGWRFKPNADHDVLPRRDSVTSGSLAGGNFLRRSNVDPLIVTELMEILLELVDQAVERVKRDQDNVANHGGYLRVAHAETFPAPACTTTSALPNLPTNAKSRSFSGAASAQLEKPQPKKRSLPYRHMKGEDGTFNNTMDNMPVSSSDDFNPDHDTLSIMEDITMVDSPDLSPAKRRLAPGHDRVKSSDDDVFTTPPTSPGITETSAESLIDPELKSETGLDTSSSYLPQSDLIQLPKFGLSKKRPFETAKPPLPRKVSRGETKRQPFTAYNVNLLRPTVPTNKLEDPFQNRPDTTSASRLVATPGLRQSSTSFDSISTATTTTTASSIAWSAHRSFASASTSTTPDTSFRLDSQRTSFTSNPVSFCNAEILDQIEASPNVSDSKTTIRSAPNTPRAKRSSATLQRAATTSSAEVQADDNDSMEIEKRGFDPRQEVFSKLLESPNIGNKTIGANSDVDRCLPNHLLSLSILPPIDPLEPPNVPYRQLYEVTRVSLFCKLPVDHFSSCLIGKIDEYEKLWSSLASVAAIHNAILPERSSLRAWEKAQKNFENVSLTGDLKFPEHADSSIFQLSLKPLKVEKSYRLARKFGGDRFCIIGMPRIEKLPPYLKINPVIMRARIVDLLTGHDISFLGRMWRAFYLKPEFAKKTRSSPQSYLNDTKYRVYFFAQDGHGFRREGAESEDAGSSHHSKMEVEEMLNWFMPFKHNLKQPCLKFFARLALGVSNTVPTVQFESFEIVWTNDARADVPTTRRLVPQSLEEKEMQEKTSQSKAPVMNDGCARISRPAALAIANMLGLSQVPCVYQGRIGGAKGIWMVDALDEDWSQSTRNFWIEITESQLKFEKHQIDAIYPDPARVTFEVHSYSRPLSAASLNFQLMPILAHQGVPKGEFERLLEEDLMTRLDELSTATENALSLRKWNQDNNVFGSEMVGQDGTQMQGGLPSLSVEKINWLIDHGFEPGSCFFLKDLLFKAIKDYCMRLENRMKIKIGKSTYAFMIADPLACLEENEIHLGFSSTFRDPKDHWEQVLLHETDVLVARLPALLSSDVQKVRAVFKPELQIYRDVVIFSSKGTCSLADKLSGGDYDGDMAWICWEPTIVGPFKNNPVSPVPPLKSYGIQKDDTKVADVMEDPDYVSKFLRHAFDFNLQADMLGSCTGYHESLCYFGTSIEDPKAIAIAALLGHLVDRAKSGIMFDESTWFRFLKKNNLRTRLEKPAYKDKEKARWTSHMIDQLVFVTAKGVREKALKEFSAKFAQVGTWDEDLVRSWNSELELAKNDQSLGRALADLKAGLSTIANFWIANIRVEDVEEGRSLRKSRPQLSFAAVVEKCRDDFLNLAPTCPPETAPSSTLGRWARGWKNGRCGDWSLVKASALFHTHHKTKIAWHVAGVELGEIKATARARGTYRVTVAGIFNAMRLDRKLVDRTRRGELEGGEEANEVGDEEDEYGGWDRDE